MVLKKIFQFFDATFRLSLNSEIVASLKKRRLEISDMILYLSNILVYSKDNSKKQEELNQELNRKSYIQKFRVYSDEIGEILKKIKNNKIQILDKFEDESFSDEENKFYNNILINIENCQLKKLEFSKNQLSELQEIKTNIDNIIEDLK